jgi:hypothetical protein
MTWQHFARIRSRWRRLALSLFLSSLVFISKFKSRRARVHWIGHHRRPLRLERALGIFIFCGGLIFLEWREYMIWAAGWGSLASAFVIWRSMRILAPRRQYHWVNK